MNTPGDIAWLIPIAWGIWLAYLAADSIWRKRRRNREAHK